MTKDEIVGQLIQARVQGSLSKSSLSRMGVADYHAITAWETAASEPRLRYLIKWANALGFDVVLKKRNGSGLTTEEGADHAASTGA